MPLFPRDFVLVVDFGVAFPLVDEIILLARRGVRDKIVDVDVHVLSPFSRFRRASVARKARGRWGPTKAGMHVRPS